MAFDSYLAERIRSFLIEQKVQFNELHMMGGLCFMVDDKMCIGVVKENLMVRIDPKQSSLLLKRKGAKPMDFTGKKMTGFLFIEPAGVDMQKDLEFWIDTCLEFNPYAKSSKKQ